MNDMIIRINNGLAHIEYKRNNIHHEKVLTADTFVNVVSAESGLETPLLPPGCRFYKKKDQDHTLFLEVPPVCRQTKYVNNGGKLIFEGVVPFPWTLLHVTLREQSDGKFFMNNSHIYALKRPILNEKDPIYFFPAANVFGNSGICWGSTFTSGKENFNSITEAGRLVDMYFSSNFNTHIHPRINGYERWEDLLRAIKDTKVYPSDVLVPVGFTFEGLKERGGGN